MRLKMVVEYDGTDFHGWQAQPDRPTVQRALEEALATILGHAVRLEGAGRTDAGVHATGQVAAFTADEPRDLARLTRSLNALAGPAIAVRELSEVSADFDPRRHATGRSYEYRLRNHAEPSPFERRYAWHVREPLDERAMAGAAAALLGEHDFRSFQAADCDAATSIRFVRRSEVARHGPTLLYRVSATAFLRHMVRNVLGTLVEVGLGRRTVADFATLLEARDRTLAGPTAPPHGLFLTAVDYEQLPASDTTLPTEES
jgi:tRNA pseudouridine38-40 synthase